MSTLHMVLYRVLCKYQMPAFTIENLSLLEREATRIRPSSWRDFLLVSLKLAVSFCFETVWLCSPG